MKRFILFLLAICALTIYAHAQVGVMRTSSAYAIQKVNPYDLGPLTRNGNVYYYHGKPMKEAEMVQFLNKNCTEAYNYYRKQHKIEMAGWGIFSAFIVTTVAIGVPMCVVGFHNENDYYEKRQQTNDPLLRKQYEEEREKYRSIGTAGLAISCASPFVVGLVGVPMIIVSYPLKSTFAGMMSVLTSLNALIDENNLFLSPSRFFKS